MTKCAKLKTGSHSQTHPRADVPAPVCIRHMPVPEPIADLLALLAQALARRWNEENQHRGRETSEALADAE